MTDRYSKMWTDSDAKRFLETEEALDEMDEARDELYLEETVSLEWKKCAACSEDVCCELRTCSVCDEEGLCDDCIHTDEHDCHLG